MERNGNNCENDLQCAEEEEEVDPRIQVRRDGVRKMVPDVDTSNYKFVTYKKLYISLLYMLNYVKE